MAPIADISLNAGAVNNFLITIFFPNQSLMDVMVLTQDCVLNAQKINVLNVIQNIVLKLKIF